MSKPPSGSPSDIIPALAYRDAPAAIRWLARAFGFRERLVVPGPDGRIEHAEMSLGDGVIMLGSAKAERSWMSPLDLPASNQAVFVYVEDVDAHHERAKAEGAEIIQPLEDTSYGSRGYSARDPEGHQWTFGTYRPGAYWAKDEP